MLLDFFLEFFTSSLLGENMAGNTDDSQDFEKFGEGVECHDKTVLEDTSDGVDSVYKLKGHLSEFKHAV